MSRTKRRLVVVGCVVVGFLAILNPSYSCAEVDGPNGRMKVEKYGFGPGRLFVFTRILADESTTTIEME